MNELIPNSSLNRKIILTKKLKNIKALFPGLFKTIVIIFMYDLDDIHITYRTACLISLEDSLVWNINSITRITYKDMKDEKLENLSLFRILPISNRNLIRWSDIADLINKDLIDVNKL